jgi:hypothetical protein
MELIDLLLRRVGTKLNFVKISITAKRKKRGMPVICIHIDEQASLRLHSMFRFFTNMNNYTAL